MNGTYEIFQQEKLKKYFEMSDWIESSHASQ